ncbi:DNA segregation ATPase FtsK/SpoIIIE, S-DNA-T family [Apibacter mensalis]|uniref:DNA segregation ATPase FtsK/SpoIIIE, S-DNA-T family n=1 Tax=Apibacter mensalis TaxID=1586267 RepID=A0A0X3AS47_9FLAO|nr:DNA translocase FtsK [Apibacter mensalis]CVK16895.1 DNA segregation ATPase FtsK/SpoIIIE, S-DNA-T family [Apibacter mensalis]
MANNAQDNQDNKKKPLLKTILGLILFSFSILLFISFTSFYFNWKEDQSQLTYYFNKNVTAQNIIGKTGAYLGEVFIFDGVGAMAFFIPFFLFILSYKILFDKEIIKIWKLLSHGIFFIIWTPIFLALIFGSKWLLSGLIGYEVYDYLKSLLGSVGTGIILLLTISIYFILEFNLSIENVKSKLHSTTHSKPFKNDDEAIKEPFEEDQIYEKIKDPKTVQSETIVPKTSSKKEILEEQYSEIQQSETLPDKENNPINLSDINLQVEESFDPNGVSHTTELEIDIPTTEETVEDDISLTIEEIKKEEILPENQVNKNIYNQFGPYDPKLDLPKYKYPILDLLTNYNTNNNITVNSEELEENKNKIVTTLANYGIGISSIKATVGPTVTLYEIIPEAGIRISKIKNLEDDIALSLAALGIRIIAPIPGKGTIGIEVPNSTSTMVSMRSVIASQKFQKIDMELPIVFGKTISNETFVTDLAKMPHMLMAGATGQGKSVGLNAIITSLLYKKHPSELKFVFVDPKKVELTLYNKIERHFLAKLPDTDEAIITDTTKVINTLNSLCVEMDNRYKLLQSAYVRTIKEYNQKFKERKLNPEKGHRFLPYIVLVIDEFADLIMTAGKEVELPIARLAQLARAIGIHLIIATQRPSVNVITGMIKANFPARVAFRVTSKIDSRTILDGNGADQLIGKGDMLFTTGNELIRMQCAFVDTPEVDKITEYIGSQQGYPDAYLLPEFYEENSTAAQNNAAEAKRDELFNDAARVIVTAQQGSTSLIQRKLSLGYNRAGRIMDQLEAFGIVGAFEGSKARKVLVTDLVSLEQLLENLTP